MKKYILSLVLSGLAMALSAMNYDEAREQARFLTDKMAYELNLNDQQYNDCYEINLDYLMSVTTAGDIYGDYLSYRNADLRHILYDWQFSLFAAADYFIRPLAWYHGAFVFPIYRHYTPGYYYYAHPVVFASYRGGHGRFYHRAGFYASRRPHWNGGFRGNDRNHHHVAAPHHGSAHHGSAHQSIAHHGTVHHGTTHHGSSQHYGSNHGTPNHGGSFGGHNQGSHGNHNRGNVAHQGHSSHSGRGGIGAGQSRGGRRL